MPPAALSLADPPPAVQRCADASGSNLKDEPAPAAGPGGAAPESGDAGDADGAAAAAACGTVTTADVPTLVRGLAHAVLGADES